MKDYKKLLDFISYFEDDDIEFCVWESGYPKYDDKLNVFIQTAYETGLLRGEYLEYLNDKIKDNDITIAIPSADLELLKSILTKYVRKERFCDGAWASAAKEKVFLRILYRLRELVET
jgi:hypothetical protein